MAPQDVEYWHLNPWDVQKEDGSCPAEWLVACALRIFLQIWRHLNDEVNDAEDKRAEEERELHQNGLLLRL